MDNDILSQLIDLLVKYGMLTRTTGPLVTTELVTLDEADIGVSSSGVRYGKKNVIEYLSSKGYPLTPKNVDMAAKKFAVNSDGKISVERQQSTIVSQTPLDHYQGNISELIQLKQLECLLSLRKTILEQEKREYAIEVVYDTVNGGADTSHMQRLLNQYSADGWVLKQAFTNELGENSSSNGFVRTNATIDQTILIFERIRHTG